MQDIFNRARGTIGNDINDCLAGQGCLFEQLEGRLLLSGTEYVVNSLLDVVADDGLVTLREAIEAANLNEAVTGDVLAGSDTEKDLVTFDEGLFVDGPGTIILGSEELVISESLDIVGPGADWLAVDGNGGSRVFRIYGGEVELTSLAITGGYTRESGGGILNGGTLTLINSTVLGNSSLGGLGAFGGGIYNGYDALTLINSTVSGNSVNRDGGGIYNNRGTVTLIDSAVSDNSIVWPFHAFDGGGIYTRYGTVTLTNSTVTGNTSNGHGGGIFNFQGKVMLTNSAVPM